MGGSLGTGLYLLGCSLDSPQSDKNYLGKIDEERKQHVATIKELKDALAQSNTEEARLLKRNARLGSLLYQNKTYAERLVLEREEMVRNHALEASELRKKNAYLIEYMEQLESSVPDGSAPGNSFPTAV